MENEQIKYDKEMRTVRICSTHGVLALGTERTCFINYKER